MSSLDPKCPQCRVPMEVGFLLDHGHGNSGQVSRWVSGEPGKPGWTGLKLKGRTLRQIDSYRCTQCGLLLDFAREIVKE